MSETRRISLVLTEEQRQTVKAVTGKDAAMIELSDDKLEERSPRLACFTS